MHCSLPFDQHVLKAGFYLEFAAGSIFILTLLITYADTMYYDRGVSQTIGERGKPENKRKGEEND